ncbi:UNVERIFIED_CONTAM: hypothetical protein Cloal_1776 [Acetivibrio alkalicellulosi]
MSVPENNTKKPTGRLNILLFIILVIVIIGTSSVAYFNANGIDIKNVTLKELIENKFYLRDNREEQSILLEIQYEIDENIEFAAHGNFIVKCTGQKVEFLNKRGEVKRTFHASFKKPLIKSAGDYLLIADVKGDSIYLFKGSEKRWEKTLSNNIINADINSMGHVTVVHEGDRSRTSATTFNNEGISYYIDNSGDEFIISAKVSPFCKSVLSNYVITSGISATSFFKLFDIGNSGEVSSTILDNEIFPFAYYINDDRILAVGESKIVVLGIDLEEKWSIPVSTEVYSVGTDEERYVAAAIKSQSGGFFSNNTDVVVYNNSGKKIGDYHIKDKVVSLTVFNDLIVANTGRQVYLITSNGRLVANYGFMSDIIKVEFFNRRELMVVTKDSLFILNTSN